MKNGKLKIIFFFSLMIFVIMFITLLVLSAATIFLIHFGILTGHGPKPLLSVFALMSLAVSTILSNVCIENGPAHSGNQRGGSEGGAGGF